MPEWLRLTLLVAVQAAMFAGLIGLVVPVYPGLLIIWLAALGYGVIVGFNTAGVAIFAAITILMLVGGLVDNVFMGAGARQGGSSWISIGVAMLAGVVGTIMFPPFGGIIAAPAAVLLLEYGRVRDWRKAWNALRGMATGWGLSVFVRFGCGVLMMVLWWVWVWIVPPA
jgi:uncharacterized protein YqgC (DUF456 family)